MKPRHVTDTLNPLMVLTGLGDDPHRLATTFRGYTAERRLTYALEGLVDDEATNSLLDSVVASGAFEGTPNTYAIADTDIATITIAQELVGEGAFVKTDAAENRYAMTRGGMQRLQCRIQLHTPQLVFERRGSPLALEDSTSWELLQVLVEREWAWQRMPSKRPPPYQSGGSLVWYTSKAAVGASKPYLLALLQAGSLDTPIEHGKFPVLF